MKHFAVVNAIGVVLRVVASPLNAPAEEDPAACVELSGWTGWPAAPFPGALLSLDAESSLSWIDPRPLDEVKAAKNAEINTSRMVANRAGFIFQGKRISTDELSRSDIDGTNGAVALTGALPAGWPGAWKADDNSYVPIPDVDTWKALYAAMVAQGAVNFATSEQLKAQLALASTPEAVAAIVWPVSTP